MSKLAIDRLNLALVLSSLGSLLGMVIWSVVDASFLVLIMTNLGRIGFGPLASWFPVIPIGHSFRPNFLAAGFLIAIGLLTIATCVTVLRRRRLTSALLMITIIGWGLFLANLTTLTAWGTTIQAQAIIPQIATDAAELFQRWPTTNGRLPSGMVFTASGDYPNVLLINSRPERYPFHEAVGRRITKSADGGIGFELAGAMGSYIEYRPNGPPSGPRVTPFGFHTARIAWSSQLEDDWYLITYY